MSHREGDTPVLLHEGHLWGVTDVVIPLADDDRTDDDGVHVSLSKHAIAQLPAVDLEQLAAGR